MVDGVSIAAGIIRRMRLYVKGAPGLYPGQSKVQCPKAKEKVEIRISDLLYFNYGHMLCLSPILLKNQIAAIS